MNKHGAVVQLVERGEGESRQDRSSNLRRPDCHL